MRTVITHFFNEEYLLPWWIRHHIEIFDYGILIDHGSTDASLEIVRELAPNWRIVRSRLTEFDAYLNDLEVMNYEQELPKSWKIALNITEFLITSVGLNEIEKYLEENKFTGISSTGFILVDSDPLNIPRRDEHLVNQKFFGYNENDVINVDKRLSLGLPTGMSRNRFYHSNPVGMYFPGRHSSFHPDSQRRANFMITAHFAYSPWTQEMKKRKTQICKKIPVGDIQRGWGMQHLRSNQKMENDYAENLKVSCDLKKNHEYSSCLNYLNIMFPSFVK